MKWPVFWRTSLTVFMDSEASMCITGTTLHDNGGTHATSGWVQMMKAKRGRHLPPMLGCVLEEEQLLLRRLPYREARTT